MFFSVLKRSLLDMNQLLRFDSATLVSVINSLTFFRCFVVDRNNNYDCYYYNHSFNTDSYKVFATRKEPGVGQKTSQRKMCNIRRPILMKFSVSSGSSQMNLARNSVKIFELPRWMTS